MKRQNVDTTISVEMPPSAKPAPVADILMKKQCEHLSRPQHRCERKDLRIGRIDI
jgi:hypothetical protein